MGCKLAEIETEIDATQLPALVQAAIKHPAPNGKILKAESIAVGDGKAFAYEVQVEVGGKKKSFNLSPDGSLLPKG